MKICFATNNENKLKEIRKSVGNKHEILSLKDTGCFEELPETCDTLEGNSLQKAAFVSNKYKVNCFADDTGLIVKSLNNAPGVYSARYAGEPSNSENNMNKVLDELEGVDDRSAKFRTVITLILEDKETQFDGEVLGEITSSKSGQDGFGYDPIFKPIRYDITFSEMNMEEKNKISHRGIAVRKLIEYLTH
jgi:XTP/dITP diphosphohydrolase